MNFRFSLILFLSIFIHAAFFLALSGQGLNPKPITPTRVSLRVLAKNQEATEQKTKSPKGQKRNNPHSEKKQANQKKPKKNQKNKASPVETLSSARQRPSKPGLIPTKGLASPQKPMLKIKTFQIPAYTEKALAAGLEGRYQLRVFVNSAGVPEKVSLRPRIGHGMDKAIKQAAFHARYQPARDHHGNPMAQWARHKITLRLGSTKLRN